MRRIGEMQKDSQVQRHSTHESVRRPSSPFSATPRAAFRSRHGRTRKIVCARSALFPNLSLFPGRTSAQESRRLLGLMADPGLEVLARGARSDLPSPQPGTPIVTSYFHHAALVDDVAASLLVSRHALGLVRAAEYFYDADMR
ncbi:hypothetical protein EV715DRAFT_293268 [Schizophyllum commune]